MPLTSNKIPRLSLPIQIRLFIWAMLICGMFIHLSQAAQFELQVLSSRNVSFPIANTGSSDSVGPILSLDGRFVVFSSRAANLVSNDFNDASDIFVRELATGKTILVSVNAHGVVGGNSDSVKPLISSNGQYVVFESQASDLVADDTNGVTDIFLRDLESGQTVLISQGLAGQAANKESTASSLSHDGLLVAFQSEATNLVVNDFNSHSDVFLRDWQNHLTKLISIPTNTGTNRTPNAASLRPLISPDGRRVAFISQVPPTASPRTNIVQSTNNHGTDLYVRDLLLNTTKLIKVANTNFGNPLVFNFIRTYNHQFSTDGRFLVFQTSVFPYADSVFKAGIYRTDLETSEITQVARGVAAHNVSGFEDITGLSLSADGNLLVFAGNFRTNLTSNSGPMEERNWVYQDVFIWSAQTNGFALVQFFEGGNTNVQDFSPLLSPDGSKLAVYRPGVGLLVKDLNSGETMTNIVSDTFALPSFNADGSLLAFQSAESDMVTGDLNQAYDVFVHDLNTRTNGLVSQRGEGLSPVAASGLSSAAPQSLSADGRWLLFTSSADDLVPNDTNGLQDVFLRDLTTGETRLVSAVTEGNGSADGYSGNPKMSVDARYVVFTSNARNLVDNDTNTVEDVYLRDMEENTITLVSRSTNGLAPATGASINPAISGDGRYVVFQSTAANLTATQVSTNFRYTYLWDRTTGEIKNVSSTVVASAKNTTIPPTISADGQVVMFVELGNLGLATYLYAVAAETLSNIPLVANHCVFGPTSGLLYLYTGSTNGLFTYEIATSNLVAVSTSVNGDPVGTVANFGPHPRNNISFTPDGRYVAFSSGNATHVSNDSGIKADIIVRDTVLGTNYLISTDRNGNGGGSTNSVYPVISADGRYVVYSTYATNLVTGQMRGRADVIWHDRQTGESKRIASSYERAVVPLMSADGSTIIFRTSLSGYVPHDYNGLVDIFLAKPNLQPNEDSDGDGLLDSWEQTHFGDLLRDGTGDFDEDGAGDSDEFLAGTIPTDAESALRGYLTELSESGAVKISWAASAGKTYRVQYKNTLEASEWLEVTGAMTISGGVGSVTDTPSQEQGQRFYRIVVE